MQALENNGYFNTTIMSQLYIYIYIISKDISPHGYNFQMSN